MAMLELTVWYIGQSTSLDKYLITNILRRRWVFARRLFCCCILSLGRTIRDYLQGRNILKNPCFFQNFFISLQKIIKDMRSKVDIDVESLISDYVKEGLGTEALATKYHIGKLKVKAILKANNIPLKKRGAQSSNEVFVVKDASIEKYSPKEGFHLEVYDKNTDFRTKDYKNNSGALTTYIKQTYNVPTPSLYDRQMYYKRTGNYWWEQWLSVEEVPNPQIKKCPYCDWTTTCIDHFNVAFGTHLWMKHKMTIEQFLKENPEERKNIHLASPTRELQQEEDESKFVVCKICGKKLRRIDSAHLSTHGITKLEYIKRYGREGMISDDSLKCARWNAQKANETMEPHFSSKAEEEIKDHIVSLGFECKKDRKILHGKELDIYIPSKQLAIEYNGNLWHTEKGGKDSNYHYDKMIKCNESGISLIQVCDDEYIEHPTVVLNELKEILGCNIKKELSPDSYKIREITKAESDAFLNHYSLFGPVRATVYIGAEWDFGMLCVMTLTFKKGIWTITRLAFVDSIVHEEVAKTMLQWFIEKFKPQKIWAYADRRWTINETDNVYAKMGMQFAKATRPDFKYYNSKLGNKRFHRMIFKRSLILERHAFPEDMPLSAMMEGLGYTKIWDCGLFKYIWKNQQPEWR